MLCFSSLCDRGLCMDPPGAGAVVVVPRGRLLFLNWHAEPPRLQWAAAEPVVLLWSVAPPVILRWSQPVAAQQNWEMYLGEDVSPVAFPEVPGGPITGWTLALTVRNSAGSIVITKTPSVADGPNGIFTWTFSNADTSSLPAGDYSFDIRRTDTGFVTELLIGRLTLQQPVGTP